MHTVIHRRLRLTPLGMGMVIIAAAAWFLAINYAINLAYFLAFWLLTFILWALMNTALLLKNSQFSAHQNGECFAHDPASIDLLIQQRLLKQRLYLRFVGQTETVVTHDPPTTADDRVQLTWITPQRGQIPLPPIEVYSHAPFALASISLEIKLSATVLVYPRPICHTLIAHDLPTTGNSGNANILGHDHVAYLDFYQAGDSLKQVAWKHYAKTGQLLSKITAAEAERLPSLISYRDYPTASDIESLASWLCWRVIEAERLQQRYFLETPQDLIEPSDHQRSRALYALAMMA